MKTTDCTASNTTQRLVPAPKNGEPISLLNKGQSNWNESRHGKLVKEKISSRLLTKEAAAKRLGCHWQTLLYREHKGELTGIRIGKRKYYVMDEIDALKITNPVHNKPNKSRRPGRGGGPGSGVIIGPAMVVHQQPKKPTLWNRIIAFFVR